MFIGKKSYSNTINTSSGVHFSNAVVTTESDRPLPLYDAFNTASNCEWSRSSNDDNNKHMPTYTIHNLNSKLFDRAAEEYNRSANSELRDGTDEEEKVDQGQWERTILISVVKKKRKFLPSTIYMANFHILINNERANNLILPLIREKILDEVASDHAKHMMNRKKCEHSDIGHLKSKITDLAPWQRIGENVCCGKSIQAIHDNIISNPDRIADKNNMRDRRFSSFGVGIATSSKGEVYVCQIFKG